MEWRMMEQTQLVKLNLKRNLKLLSVSIAVSNATNCSPPKTPLNPTMKRSININVLTSAAFASTALSQSSFSRSIRSRAVEPDGGVAGSGNGSLLHDAACLVAKLKKERDEARELLGQSKGSILVMATTTVAANVPTVANGEGLEDDDLAPPGNKLCPGISTDTISFFCGGSTQVISADTYRNYVVLAGDWSDHSVDYHLVFFYHTHSTCFYFRLGYSVLPNHYFHALPQASALYSSCRFQQVNCTTFMPSLSSLL
ncbi:unnamed protein product [Linum trigynum]|uniref:Uncharacterized protein n=1 Tax=Linum trigynum TaxID=586398 RepID=A0AAV2FZX0_9ROSI